MTQWGRSVGSWLMAQTRQVVGFSEQPTLYSTFSLIVKWVEIIEDVGRGLSQPLTAYKVKVRKQVCRR